MVTKSLYMLLIIVQKSLAQVSYSKTTSAPLCMAECINLNQEFCVYADHSQGFCCSGGKGCPADLKRYTEFCSFELVDELKPFVCPNDDRCGEQKVLTATSEVKNISVDPQFMFMVNKETCIYKVVSQEKEYVEGDVIELFNIKTD